MDFTIYNETNDTTKLAILGVLIFFGFVIVTEFNDKMY